MLGGTAMNAKAVSLAVAISLCAGLRLAAQSPIAVLPSWELRLIATNGRDCAFSYVDKAVSPTAQFLQVGQRRIGPFARVENLGWSPDGSTLGFCAGDGPLTTVYVNEKPRGSFSEVWEFIWAPRGGDLAVVGKRDKKEVLDLNSGSVELYDFSWGPLDPGTGFRDAQWTPDGEHLYFVFAQDYDHYQPWEGLKPMPTAPGWEKLSLSPDGRTLAHSTLKALYRGDTEIASGSIVDIAWAPDSKRLAYARRASGTSSFEVYVDGAKTASVQAMSFRGISWSPDGAKLCIEYVDSKKDRYLSVNGKKMGPFVDDLMIRSILWSPDSKHLAYPAQRKGAAGAWKLLIDDAELGPFPGKPYLPASPWSTDGGQIAFSIVWAKTGSGLYVDGKPLVEGRSIRDVAWAEGSSILAYARDDDGIVSSMLLRDGKEIPGAIFRSSVVALEGSILTIAKAK
jgi:WD40 repeat protein